MTNSAPFAQATMQRALELAERGRGRVEPNPMVGAVIVDEAGKVLAEGWHQEFGGPHAEIHAIAAAGPSACGATLFVTLEPCCHFGKTPPCTKAIIAAGIRKVIVAMPDPAPHVDGNGIRELRNAGIEVEVGLLEQRAKKQVAPFVRLMTGGRSWFHAKWAMTLDGKIASRTGHSKWITNEASRALVHQLRGRMDGILAGIGTVLSDDPMLTARPAGPRIPTRIVIDSLARTPVQSQLVQTIAQGPVLVVVTPDAPVQRCEALRASGAEVLIVDSDSQGHPSLESISMELGRRRWTNVLVEGGGRILGSFFDAGLIDEVHAFIAPKLVGGANAPSPLSGTGLGSIPKAVFSDPATIQLLDGDIYVHGQVGRPPAIS